jgi:uncharacterized membrane protein
MATVERSIEVDLPVRTVYNQWTQFEDFPHFMEGVEEVRQLDDTRVYWVATVAGQRREWESKITEQKPDSFIAWYGFGGATNQGEVTFEPVGADRTRLTVRMDFDPEDFVEKAGDALGLVERRVQGDLERFKEFIESRGRETGAWRGEVEGGEKRS